MELKDFFDAHPEERSLDIMSDEFGREMQAEMAKAHAMAEREGIPFMAAYVIVRDKASDARSRRWVEMGLDVADAMPFVGSFGRLDFAMWAVEQGHMTRADLLADLPDLWRGSDPDDTDPRFADLWAEAKAANGGRYVADTTIVPLPVQPDGVVVIYRGQYNRHDPANGIAWSTDRRIAEKFAATGGLRGASGKHVGRMHTGRIHVDHILGWLTGRGESEVVVDLSKVVLA
jgi:hypothetical protein